MGVMQNEKFKRTSLVMLVVDKQFGKRSLLDCIHIFFLIFARCLKSIWDKNVYH